jgi:hypothetical protein
MASGGSTARRRGPSSSAAQGGALAPYDKGETTFDDNGNTRIETGATILGGVRNEFRDVYKRVVK